MPGAGDIPGSAPRSRASAHSAPPEGRGEFQRIVPAERAKPSRRRNRTRPSPALARAQPGSGVAVDVSRRGPAVTARTASLLCRAEPEPPSRSPLGAPNIPWVSRAASPRSQPRSGRTRAHPAPEVGLGRALADPLPAAGLYKSPLAAGAAPEGARGGRDGPAAPCPAVHAAPHQHRVRAGHRAVPGRVRVSAGQQIRFSPLLSH